MDTGADVTEPYSRGAEAALAAVPSAALSGGDPERAQPILRLRDDIRRNLYRHIDGRETG